jgi:hypothetical protein
MFKCQYGNSRHSHLSGIQWRLLIERSFISFAPHTGISRYVWGRMGTPGQSICGFEDSIA